MQNQVNVQPAPAVAGDFCDSNPRVFVDAGPGGLVVGPAGLIVGRAAWWSALDIDPDGAPQIVANSGLGPITGIVHRAQQGLNTTFLSDSSMGIPSGFPAGLMSAGGIWVKNDGAGEALVGQVAYANYADGRFTFAAAGAPASASVTGAITAATAAFTGSIAGDVLTVTATSSGTIYPGATLTGTGTGTNNQVVGQLTGTPGGIGTYAVAIPEEVVASEALGTTYGLLTVTAVGSGVLGLDDTLSGTNVVAGTAITALITGTGGNGTYVVNNNTAVASTTITAGLQVQTKFVAMSAGAPGELVKISSHLLG